jgi:hypothetical protein
MSRQKPKDIYIQEELERRILHGLACEWDSALWTLKTSHRNKMNKPLFSLRDMNGKWGYWSGEKNEICLSRNLVLDHPWDAVREILLHEMAHQLAEQVLDAHDEAPHGQKFKQACFLLRASPRASDNFRPLDERISKDSPNPEDRILIRVRKLMALAQSKNQHEAEAAMTKAHELISKYNVDLLARDDNRHFVSVFVGSPALRHFREDYHLSNLLQKYYFAYGIWVPSYVMEKSKMGRVLEISGTVQNIRIAAYIHDFIRHFINARWDEYNRGKGHNRYRKTDFAVGVIEGFRSKLSTRTNKGKDDMDTWGLMEIQDPLLQEHVNYRYPHTSNVRGRALNNDKHILKDGKAIGRDLVIHKGISKRGKGRKLLN